MRNKCGNTKWGASKDKRILEGNLYNKFAVMTSPCDSDSKNQVERSTEFTVLEKNLVYESTNHNKETSVHWWY